MDGDELVHSLEAVLYAAGRPLSIRALMRIFEDEATRSQLREALAHIERRLEESGAGVRLHPIAGGFQLLTEPQYARFVERIEQRSRGGGITAAQLETLAIIAYKQPVTRLEVESIRGAASGHLIRSLIDKGLVRITGKADTIGSPFLYGTSKKFLEQFGLGSLKELPQTDELELD